MHYDKPATTIDDQMALLVERGMGVDRALLRRWLETVGYYWLSAYWLSFEVPPNADRTRSKRFADGMCFEDIVDIYVFDRNLRLLVMEAIERVEIALRSRWTNRLALAHGSHAHLDTDAFQSGYGHIRLLSALANRTENSNEEFVEHYRKKYVAPFMPPLWIVTELMTFGELSRWFAATRDPRVKSAIAKDLGLPSREVLEGTLQLFAYIRNICAHHGRLWNRQTVKRLPLIRRFRNDLDILPVQTPQGPQYQPANNLYNPLVALVHMLRHQSADTSFPERLKALIKTRSATHMRAMGFPADWETRQCWVESKDSN